MQIRLVDDFRKAATAFGDRSPESFRLTARRGMARQQSDRIHDQLSYGIRQPLLAARRSDAPEPPGSLAEIGCLWMFGAVGGRSGT
ncbi:hypothetical protein AS026_30970 [Rhizobium altiplani]|uniref:Uncharacterized protein n=1 Tax=Rhizobium altiplani TaxID=1864509 RepID=A0A120FPZ0_9HYPH|nr:hypothetical protein AS026_30970 [Rhizobium altiplani]